MNTKETVNGISLGEYLSEIFFAINKAQHVITNFEERYCLNEKIIEDIPGARAESTRNSMVLELAILNDYVCKTYDMIENLLSELAKLN